MSQDRTQFPQGSAGHGRSVSSSPTKRVTGTYIRKLSDMEDELAVWKKKCALLERKHNEFDNWRTALGNWLFKCFGVQYDSITQVMKTIKAIDVSGKGNHEFEEGESDNASDPGHDNGIDLNIEIGSVKVENGLGDSDTGQSETLRLEELETEKSENGMEFENDDNKETLKSSQSLLTSKDIVPETPESVCLGSGQVTVSIQRFETNDSDQRSVPLIRSPTRRNSIPVVPLVLQQNGTQHDELEDEDDEVAVIFVSPPKRPKNIVIATDHQADSKKANKPSSKPKSEIPPKEKQLLVEKTPIIQRGDTIMPKTLFKKTSNFPSTSSSSTVVINNQTSGAEGGHGSVSNAHVLVDDHFDLETDDPTPCSVCGVIDPEPCNEMVFCDTCGVCVHQICYGVRNIPLNGWKCNPCAAGLNTLQMACYFCPQIGGALKPVKSPAMRHWAHVSCALWIPEVNPESTITMEPIVNVNKIPKDRWKLKCSLCKKVQGACIQCQYNKRCVKAFHVTCAMKHGLEMRETPNPGGPGCILEAYCQMHTYSTKNGHKIKKKERVVVGKGSPKKKQMESSKPPKDTEPSTYSKLAAPKWKIRGTFNGKRVESSKRKEKEKDKEHKSSKQDHNSEPQTKKRPASPRRENSNSPKKNRMENQDSTREYLTN